MPRRPELLEVRADRLRLGDVLEEGCEVVQLTSRDGVISATTTGAEYPWDYDAGELVRVVRLEVHRAGLAGEDGVTCIANADATLRLGPGEHLARGDLRIRPLP